MLNLPCPEPIKIHVSLLHHDLSSYSAVAVPLPYPAWLLLLGTSRSSHTGNHYLLLQHIRLNYPPRWPKLSLIFLLFFCGPEKTVDNTLHVCAQWVFSKYLQSVSPLTSNSAILGNKIQVQLDIPWLLSWFRCCPITDARPASLPPLKPDSSVLPVSCSTQDPFNSLRDVTLSILPSCVYSPLLEEL